MSASRVVFASILALTCSAPAWAQDASPRARRAVRAERRAPRGPFVARPYLQPGATRAPGALALLWHADDADAPWAVDVRKGADAPWQAAGPAEFRRVAVAGVAPHRVYRVAIRAEPGARFTYRVRKGNDVVFEAEARGPKSAAQPHRFAVFGDCGADTPEQRQVAFRTFQARPDLVMITGDIVYGKGLSSEYATKFWPIYNADEASPETGAPLLRSTLFVAAPGNHDIASRDLDKTPDGLAYFYYWSQPRNGPDGKEGGPLVARVIGSAANRRAFLEAAGDAFPRMANFSFDYGNAHWTVLDANATVDWTDRALQDWVARDLAAARGATWRFVSFHQPGFNSSKKHFGEQYMRILAPVFEAGRVDVVFNGHVHNYQRTFPLRFAPSPGHHASPIGADGKRPKDRHVDGRLTLDRTFDGARDTTPEGVIYVVSGAGGQDLYNPEQQDDPTSWQEFTFRHISKVHSLTVADVDGPTLTVRQVTPAGEEVDRFVITK